MLALERSKCGAATYKLRDHPLWRTGVCLPGELAVVPFSFVNFRSDKTTILLAMRRHSIVIGEQNYNFLAIVNLILLSYNIYRLNFKT
jgi:hypothetical protein